MTAAATDKRNRSTRLAAAIAGLALVAACACQTVPAGNAIFAGSFGDNFVGGFSANQKAVPVAAQGPRRCDLRET